MPWSYFRLSRRRTASFSLAQGNSPDSTAILIPKKHCDRDSSSAFSKMWSTPAWMAMAQARGSGHFFRIAAMPMASETMTPSKPSSPRKQAGQDPRREGGGQLVVVRGIDGVRRHDRLGTRVDRRLEGHQFELRPFAAGRR